LTPSASIVTVAVNGGVAGGGGVTTGGEGAAGGEGVPVVPPQATVRMHRQAVTTVLRTTSMSVGVAIVMPRARHPLLAFTSTVNNYDPGNS
jgi:hypothetical protein